jgi:hypothetical protein
LDLKPTRRITKSHCSVTGKKPSIKTGKSHQFESTLERDYISLLEFDDQVVSYIEQPLIIYYFHDGKDRTYTPDFLTIYNPSSNTKPLLSEIKYKADLQLHRSEYQPKFDAAIKFADENGYQFTVITEEDIRTVYLQNAVFLNRFLHTEIDRDQASFLLASLSGLHHSTPEGLIGECGNTTNCKGELLYVLWQLVAKKEVSCNLNTQITMHSDIWISPLK